MILQPLPTETQLATIKATIEALESLLKEGPERLDLETHFRAACRFRREVATLKKQLTDLYKPSKSERFQAHREATGAEKVQLEPISFLGEKLDKLILDYIDRKEALNEDIGLAAEDSEDDEAAFESASESLSSQVGKIRGITVKRGLKIEVTDIRKLITAAGDAVPEDWLVPDLAAIGKALEDENLDQQKIAILEAGIGIKVTPVKTISARALSVREANGRRAA